MTTVLPPRTKRTRRLTVRRHIDPRRPQPVGVPVRVRWPVTMTEALYADLTGHLPIPVARLVAEAERRGYAAGRRETLEQAARSIGELDLLGSGWRDDARTAAREQRRQERAAIAERARFENRQRNIAAGRHPDWTYLGQSRGGSGAVDWETGYPVETVDAWKRRQALTVVEDAA